MIKIKLNLDPVKGEQVILVTSSMAEEGKTYFAENLASIYAHAGKKTLLMGFDFHHPVIAESFDLAGDEGITNYLIHDIPLEKVIRKTFTKNLDILLPGPVPPTSDELIESDKNKQLFTELRRRYEFIIMDTPPLGMVGDAFLLNRFSDVTLFMVRYNFSVKKQFAKAIGEAAENGMKRIMIVFTDIKLKVKIKDINFADEKKSGKNLILMIIMQIRKGVIYLLRKF
jgi:capsular exopolysaccharide synthesis family protein